MSEQDKHGSENNEGVAEPTERSGVSLSRRKLAYVAPALVSRAMFYGAGACGKGKPTQITCSGPFNKGNS